MDYIKIIYLLLLAATVTFTIKEEFLVSLSTFLTAVLLSVIISLSKTKSRKKQKSEQTREDQNTPSIEIK